MATKNALTENTVALLQNLTLSLRLRVDFAFSPTEGEMGGMPNPLAPISPLVGEKAISMA